MAWLRVSVRKSAIALLRALLFVLAWTSVSQIAHAAPTFALDQPIVALAPGSTIGKEALVLTGSNLPAGLPSTPKLTDVGSPDAEVTFVPKLIGRSDDAMTWHIDVTVARMPLNVEQARHLSVALGGTATELSYKLSNLYSRQFEWFVTPPATKRVWSAGDRLRLLVRVGAVAASNVRLLHTGLVDADSSTVVDAPIFLCKADEKTCDGKPFSLSANQTHELYLIPTGDIVPGKYGGTLVLVADQKVTGDPITVELSVTSVIRQIFGCVTILVGIAIALLIGPFNRARINRLQILRPAVLLRDQIIAVQTRIGTIQNVRLDKMSASLEAASLSLTEDALDKKNVLPPSMPLYYGAASNSATIATFQGILDAASARLNTVTLLLDRGVVPALTMPHLEAHREDVVKAIEGLDELAADPSLPLENLRTQIDAALQSLDALNQQDAARERGLDTVGRLQDNRPLSTSRIDFDVQSLNVVGWATFAILSALIGSLFLVFRDPAFGTFLDFLTCALWGFGLPVAGQQLATVTSPAIASSVGVNLTR